MTENANTTYQWIIYVLHQCLWIAWFKFYASVQAESYSILLVPLMLLLYMVASTVIIVYGIEVQRDRPGTCSESAYGAISMVSFLFHLVTGSIMILYFIA